MLVTGVVARAPALEPAELGLVINRSDPRSVRIGAYYQLRRGIPDDAVVSVRFPPATAVMKPRVFRALQADLHRGLPPRVQALALAWTFPFRVGCMSITTAFAAGFDVAFCAQGCLATRESPYFDSPTPKPHRDHRWRPAMLLAGSDEAAVRDLIDRGVASDATYPSGTGYLVSTSDKQRNVRARYYPMVQRVNGRRFALERVDADALVGRQDVMFYLTGRAWVSEIDTNRFLPGAVADHLTSAGGNLRGTKQMSRPSMVGGRRDGKLWRGGGTVQFPPEVPEPRSADSSVPRW